MNKNGYFGCLILNLIVMKVYDTIGGAQPDDGSDSRYPLSWVILHLYMHYIGLQGHKIFCNNDLI